MPADASFGVPPLDRLLGGIPPTSALLLENDPGVEAEPFLYQFTYHHLRGGLPVVYCVTNRTPASVRSALRDFGFDDPEALKRLHFVDAFSGLFGGSENEAYTLASPKDLTALGKVLAEAARDHPSAVLVIDSLSTLVDRVTLPVFLSGLGPMRTAVKSFGLSAALFTRWPYEEDLAPLRQAFDGVVSLHGVEERVLFSQYFSVERAAWLTHLDPRPLLYKTKKPGGVFVYLPKIVVTGPHHAGKTTFIHSAADQAASSEFRGTTVGMDHGQVMFEGLKADLFGTPGQERFDPLLKTIAGEALGVIVVVDSTRPESFPRAKEMLQKVWRQGLPAIIAACKQDMAGASPPELVARLIEAPEHVRVVGCVAVERESARRVLKQLIDQILHPSGGVAR